MHLLGQFILFIQFSLQLRQLQGVLKFLNRQKMVADILFTPY